MNKLRFDILHISYKLNYHYPTFPIPEIYYLIHGNTNWQFFRPAKFDGVKKRFKLTDVYHIVIHPFGLI